MLVSSAPSSHIALLARKLAGSNAETGSLMEAERKNVQGTTKSLSQYAPADFEGYKSKIWRR
jgi:hypothetical protein